MKKFLKKIWNKIKWIFRKKGGDSVPTGLQVYDASGNITLDMTNRLTQMIGIARTNGLTGSLKVPVDGNRILFAFSNEGYPFIYCVGDTIYWKIPNHPGFTELGNSGLEFYYGVA